MLSLAEVTAIAHEMTGIPIDEKIYLYNIVTFTIMSVLTSIAHWIFAVQYLEVVLLLPLLFEHGEVNIQKKRQRVRWVINGANAYFFIQVGAWACFMFAYTDYEDSAGTDKIKIFDAVNKLLPGIVLIISVLVLRSRFNGKKSNKFFAREKVIVVHVALFLFYILTYAIFRVLTSLDNRSPQESIQYCRLFM